MQVDTSWIRELVTEIICEELRISRRKATDDARYADLIKGKDKFPWEVFRALDLQCHIFLPNTSQRVKTIGETIKLVENYLRQTAPQVLTRGESFPAPPPPPATPPEGYYKYEKKGLHVFLPKGMRVNKHTETTDTEGKVYIYFDASTQHESIRIEIHNGMRTGLLHELNLLDEKSVHFTVEKRGAARSPYSGWEVIGGIWKGVGVWFGWEAVMYPAHQVSVIVRFGARGEFQDDEQTLRTVVLQSLRFDPSQFQSSFQRDPAEVNRKPVKPGIINIGTENNLFMVGPKNAERMLILDSQNREVEQGFASAPDRFDVYFPEDCIDCEIEAKETTELPSLKGVHQAFCVPLRVAEGKPLHVHMDDGSVSEQSLDIKPGEYDVVVALKLLDAEELSWRARMYFLPKGTVGPRVLKLKGRSSIPKEAYIRQGCTP